MDILFVHNNFPAQFRHVVARLLHERQHRLCAIGSATARQIRGVHVERYELPRYMSQGAHPYASSFDTACRRAEQVLKACERISDAGFDPQIVLAHCGWGESLPLREAFPRAKLTNYCEFYYRAEGLDVNFDPEFPSVGIEDRIALQLRNATSLLSLIDGDDAISPTQWQKSTYPHELHAKIKVLHEGVDTSAIVPDPNAVFELPTGGVLTRNDEVVTFLARNLEPLRGYHIFMRSLPYLMSMRPRAHIVIVGGDGVSYGAAPPKGLTWKSKFLHEVADRIDRRRVHFVGTLQAPAYRAVLQVSNVHVYLTYPFIASWSLLDAMSAGCAVVASRTGPVEEIIDGRNGLLVPFFDYEGIAHHVSRLLADPERRKDLGERARETAVASYDVKACTARIRRYLLSEC
jgi:glycosyltransferase involved in cell wall biosynthesis